jgi:hypothetical protein
MVLFYKKELAMKIKVNVEKQTVSLKGLTPMQFGLIEQLLMQVCLGTGTEASEAAFEVLEAIECCEELEFIEPTDIQIIATTEEAEGVTIEIDDPTLYARERDINFDDGGPYYGVCGDIECATCDDDC